MSRVDTRRGVFVITFVSHLKTLSCLTKHQLSSLLLFPLYHSTSHPSNTPVNILSKRTTLGTSLTSGWLPRKRKRQALIPSSMPLGMMLVLAGRKEEKLEDVASADRYWSSRSFVLLLRLVAVCQRCITWPRRWPATSYLLVLRWNTSTSLDVRSPTRIPMRSSRPKRSRLAWVSTT